MNEVNYSHKFVIIGAGPCGLGAALRLNELGQTDWVILERESYAGGLAASFVDSKGFTWDIGGHVQFSHYTYFDQLMDMLLGENWIHHERESWVWLMDRFVPYPFQLNIHRLPEKERDECFKGLENIIKNDRPQNFEEWILATAGSGIAKYFLFPYNFKVWAHHPREMNSSWVGERVAVTDIARVKRNIQENKDDVSWGPNKTFRFPLHGGTGAIWNALADKVGRSKIKQDTEVINIDSSRQILTLKNAKNIQYEHLISTMPLDVLINHSDQKETLGKPAQLLLHSTTHIVGVGLKGKPKEELKTKCWMYFPEANCPFYRVTLFSKYSPFNVPDIKENWSLMTEVSESVHKPVDEKSLVVEVIQGLRNTKLISSEDEIVSTWQYKTNYGYPTPSIHRDEVINDIQPILMKKNIYSRGRFGMWKYEVSNQDHSLMQGKEIADFLVQNIREETAWNPNLVNTRTKK